MTLRVKKGYSVHTKVLSLCKPEQRSCLSSWNWDLDPSCAKFHACFPYSWTVFDDPVPNVRVTVQQTSPFLPGDYGNSSIPAACFSVTVENKSSFEDIEVSVMLSFQNGSENPDWEVNDDWSHFPFQCPTDELSHEKLIKGVCLPHRTRRTVVKTSETSTVNPALSGVQGSNTPNSASFVEDKGSYAIAGDGTDGGCISICPKFITMRSSEPDVRSAFSLCSTDESSMTDSGDESLSAQTLWRAFRDTGDICSFDDLPSFRSGALYGAAVCIRKVIPRATASMSNNVSNFNFSLAWDHPVARFGAGLGLPRYYTKFFGCSGLAAPLMATYALAHLEDWKTHINEWQKSTTEKIDSYQMRSSMSDYQKKEAEFYNSQVFNELYYLVDGGTLWTDSCSGTSNQGHLDLNKPVDELLVHYEAQIFTVHETIAQSITIKRSSVDQGSSITPDIDSKPLLYLSSDYGSNSLVLFV